MTEANFSVMGDADDLPRTLRREREARERAKREEEERKRKATLTHDYDVRLEREVDRPARVLAAAGGVVTGFDVPFLHLMRFFIKAVLAAIPALILLGVMLWFAGAALKSVYPGLVHTEVLIRVPR